jgi:GTP-binding protein
LQVRVKKAVYVKSSVNLSQCPKPKLPEFAVIGRSNVGKSSLINMLTGQGSLAKVSKTPGGLHFPSRFCILLPELDALTSNESNQ